MKLIKRSPTTGHNTGTNASLIEGVSDPEQLMAAFFHAPTVGLAVFDDRLHFQSINNALARIHGVPIEAHLGKTLRDVLGDAADEIEPILRHVSTACEPVLNFELACQLRHRPEVGHWIGHFFPLKDPCGKVIQIGVLVVEVTQQKKLQASLRMLTRRLLRAKDEEQRRVARELHDSINQYHMALKMNLLRLRRTAVESAKRGELLTECLELLEQCMTETRTISYLLHPPLLDEMGFASATRWYVKGFAQRSGIKVNLNLPSELERLPSSLEIALFRVLQEALTNVHRHAQTTTLDIDVEPTQARIVLQVRDYGRGIPAAKLHRLEENTGATGVGIASMRERVHELGGLLQIQSDLRGTIIRAEVPIPSVMTKDADEILATAASA